MGTSLFDLDKTGSDKIRDNSSSRNLERLMNMYGSHYRSEFEQNHEKKVPRHPWHIFKSIRQEIRETHEGDEKHERVFVAEELFQEYKSKWETYRAQFEPGNEEQTP